jgi:4-aminobutyrate aminotransferase-like enzyme
MFGSELPSLTSAVPGPRSSALADVLAQAECPALTARRARRAEQAGASHDPVVWAEARGANVRDVDRNVFVDLTGGFGAALFAHQHEPIIAAVTAQLGQLSHALGDLQPSAAKVEALHALAALAPFPARVILGLSGADAIEAALKSCMLATRKPGVIAFVGGYHGLSHGPLAACGYGEGFRAPFAAQLNPHVRFVPYPRRAGEVDEALSALDRAASSMEAGALLVEPLQGRGGMNVPAAGFLARASQLAHRRGILVVADEIYSGLHRTGDLFASTYEAMHVDLLCLGKGLGGGLPISACLGREELMAAWGDPAGEAIHTSTFLGNPLACAAALATLRELAASDCAAIVLDRERVLREALAPLRLTLRGRGLMLGIELGGATRVLAAMRGLLERGYIVVPGGAPPDVLTLTPPVCLSDAQIAGFARALGDVLGELP